ncbi:DUF6415 family natural product biosynthesis protein [Streptomyces chartreusis]|uniref:DUF6415 family natural product biosynthesis protein n=1 Tax=Streptomyces chartreusis TaxID=1969 RepID=UPI0037F23208
MTAAVTNEDTRTESTTSMRAAADWFLAQRVLPRHTSLRLCSDDFFRFCERLSPEIQELVARLPRNDVLARAAMEGVSEARRRMYEPEAAGLLGETARVTRLARSVVALCNHHDALTGAVMCPACEKPIKSGEPTAPYGKVSPSGGAVQAGRIHAACASTGTSRR